VKLASTRDDLRVAGFFSTTVTALRMPWAPVDG